MECHRFTVKSRQRKDSSTCSTFQPVITILILATQISFYHLVKTFIPLLRLSFSRLLTKSLETIKFVSFILWSCS